VTEHWIEELKGDGFVCRAAVEWAQKYESPATAWRRCPCGLWMLWLLNLARYWPQDDPFRGEFGWNRDRALVAFGKSVGMAVSGRGIGGDEYSTTQRLAIARAIRKVIPDWPL